MTDVQIKYWANRIADRHNREMEAQGRTQLGESERHNKAGERVSMLQAMASQAQAAAAQRNAATNARLADLNAARLQLEDMIAGAEIALKTSQSELNTANAELATQRVAESQQSILESQANTAYTSSRTRTENVLRIPRTIGEYADAAGGILTVTKDILGVLGKPDVSSLLRIANAANTSSYTPY